MQFPHTGTTNPQFPLTDWAGNLLSPCKKYNTALAVFRSVCYTYHDFRGESQKAVARRSGATLLATRAAAFAFSLPLPDLLQCCPLFFKEYSTFAGQNTLSAPTQLSGDRTPRLTRRNTPSIRQNSPSFSAPFWLGTNNQRCKESGLSTREYCRQNGISEKTFYYWLRKLREAAIDKQPELVALPEGDRSADDMIHIRFGAAVLELPAKADAEAIATLLQALQRL